MKCIECGEHADWMVAATLVDGSPLGGKPACVLHRDIVWSGLPDGATVRFVERPPQEPAARGSVVRDRFGDLWERGNTRWTCTAAVDGDRVQQVARLPWDDVWRRYGPLTTA